MKASDRAVVCVLPRLQRNNNVSKYNPIFEFDFMMPRARPGHETPANGRQVRMLVTSVAGHIFEHDFEAGVKGWHSCDPAKLLDTSVQVKPFIPEANARAHENCMSGWSIPRLTKCSTPHGAFTFFVVFAAEIQRSREAAAGACA